jgi:hypothetical protein
MICTTLAIADFVASSAPYVRDHLTRPGSDFQKKLTAWIDGTSKPTDADGHIALVLDHGEIIGWARTEQWSAGDDGADGYMMYDTLEAFVAPSYRLRGIAAFAASGIFSAVLHENGGTVAVFHPHMLLVARRAGFWPTLFEKEGGQWLRVQ